MKINISLKSCDYKNFGKIGKIKSLPFSPQKIETEATVRILEVEFPDGTTAVVPRTNIEMIEA